MKTIGVIGLGSIGMRHAKNLVAMGNKVIGYDPLTNQDQTDLDFLFNNSDAIVIASPTSAHAEHLILACNSGVDIFVEKPVADRWLDVNATMVGYNLRFHSCVKKAKEWLDAGLIGRPIWANFTCAQWNDKPAYLRDGVILNWSHEIDLALYLLGPASVTGSSTHIVRGLPDPMTRVATENDDMTDIMLRHHSGCQTTVHLDYLTRPEQRFFRIVGESGWIYVDLKLRVANLTINNEAGDYEAFVGDDSFDENYVEEMRAFIDRIDGKETIGCTGAEGLEVLKICLEVRKQAGLE